MKIKLTNVLFYFRKKLPIIIMRSFLFLLCTAAFSFTPSNILSQNAKIKIDADKTVSIHEVFKLISNQTDYKFIFPEDLFKNAPTVQLKKGIIKANRLLELSLSYDNFNFVFANNGSIVLNKKNKDEVQQQVSGSVTDPNGIGLPGVTVLEKGTSNGVSTNIEGKYSIKVSSSNAVLVFSFIGFTTQEIIVNAQSEINITLKESVFELETVNLISTGYETITKEKMTGAAQSIEQSYYQGSFKQTLQEGLQGSVPGLQIFSNNSHPQSVPQVIIRGVGSAFQEGVGFVGFGQPTSVLGNPATLTPGSPLYVIDGVPTFDGRDLSSINGNDIKSITVLKDAAASSIYGARAANGVIVVETKSGKAGKSRVTYSSQIGFSDFTNLNERLNNAELQELYIEGLINKTSNGITTPAAALAFLAAPGGRTTPFSSTQDTNWGNELTRSAVMKQHNISVSGGKNANRYYLSLGYLENESPLKEIDFSRVTVKFKYDTEISEKLNVSTNIGYGKTQSNNHETGSSYYSPYRSMYLLRPDLNIYNDDGTYDTSYNYGVNPLGILTDETRALETNDFRGALNLKYEVIPNLTLETSLSGNYRLNENYNNFPDYIGKGLNNRSSFGIQKNTNVFTWNTRALVRYAVQLDENHNLNMFVGIENNGVDAKATNVSVNALRAGSETLDNGETVDTYTTRRETALSSAFLNASYSYQNKYLVNASYRRDGSSRFGVNNKYGNFYALGLGWNIHKEDFMANSELFNQLKLRVSYGINGNDQIDPFGYSGTFNGTGSYNGNNVATIVSAGNASIGWEENATFDIGVDFSILNNRVSGFVDYYNRKTSNLLYNLPVSSLNGDTYVFQNFGGMENSGIELSLNTKNINTTDFSWTTGINFTTNNNKITELDSDEILSGNYIRTVGQDFNTLNLYGYAGVDPDTGSELYYTDETESATTGVLSQAKKYNHGKTTPDYYGSLINTFTYKNFSLTAHLYTSWGGQIFETKGYLQNDNGNLGLRDFSNTSKYVYNNRWQQPGDVTDVPKYVYGNSRSRWDTSRWLHDASFVRLKKLELAYNFSNKLLEKTFIDRLRLHISGDNIWTSTKDDTLKNDPELGGITGASSFNTPLTKTVYFGLNVSF
jgi:TonB-linked SusC/RagA family outer membrane protein